MSCHSARNAVKVCWPAAARFELVVRFVQGRAASRAGVNAFRRVMFIVFATEGGFGSFLAYDAELFYSICSVMSATGVLEMRRQGRGPGSDTPLFSTARHSFGVR